MDCVCRAFGELVRGHTAQSNLQWLIRLLTVLGRRPITRDTEALGSPVGLGSIWSCRPALVFDGEGAVLDWSRLSSAKTRIPAA